MGNKGLSEEDAARLAGVSVGELKMRARKPSHHDAFSDAIQRAKPAGATPEDPSGMAAMMERTRSEIMSGPGGKARAELDIASGGAARPALEHHTKPEPVTP